MLRVPLSLAVVLSALFAVTAVAEAAETWEPADKQAFGTAHDLRSKVWFTLGPTGMGEAYWPRIDRPAVRSLDLKVGGRSESALATGQVTPADPRSLTPRQVVTARDGAWRITKTYVTDPARDVVLVDMDVRSLNGRPLHLSTDLRAGLDKDRRAQTALLARPALRGVDGIHGTHVTLALGLGRTKQAAQDAASASLGQGFPALSASYAKGWHDYLDSLPPRPAAAAPYAALYDTSLMVLAAAEDKTYRGASVASPSMPWVWGAELDREALRRLPPGLVARPLPGGHRPAGGRATARPPSARWTSSSSASRSPTARSRRTPRSTARAHWTSIQLDQVALPIVLAWQLGRTDAARLAHVPRARPSTSSRTARSPGRSAGRTRRLVAGDDRRRDRRPRDRRRPRRAGRATPRPPRGGRRPPTPGSAACRRGPPRRTARSRPAPTTCA